MIVGRVSKVDGIKAVGVFYEKLPPHLLWNGEATPAPQINSYVKTNVGLDIVICQIVGEHEFEYDKFENRQDIQTEEFVVDLEVRGRAVNGNFLGGLRCLPIVGAKIETLNDSDYVSLFSGRDGIRIGTNLFDSSNQIFLDINRLIPSHIGVFGNTGSGKSNTLSKILKGYISMIPEECDNAHVLLFDLNNEYGGNAIVNAEKKCLYELTTKCSFIEDDKKIKKIQIDFMSLTDDNWGTLLKASPKTQMPVVRRAYNKWKRENTDYVEEIKRMLVNKRVQMFFTLREYGEDFIDGIDEVRYHNKAGSFFYQKEDGRKVYIESKDTCPDFTVRKMNKLQRFLLELIFEISKSSESGTNFEFIQPLLPRARVIIKNLDKTFINVEGAGIKDIFSGKKVAVIQLGNVNAETREAIPSLISELVFQDAIQERGEGKTKSIVSIVIDEAHNLLAYDPEKTDRMHDNTLRVFERVIKEGRKFGIFLYLSSQRPSDISNTITSQIHNYFIHKLVNPNDIEKIRKTVSFMGDASLSMLSALGQGECIISGPSLYLPQYVYVDELDEDSKPNSNDLKIVDRNGKWII